MEFEYLETPRLRLRKYDAGTYQYLFTKCSEEEIMRFFCISTPEELAKERNRFEGGLDSYDRRFIGFHLIDKENELPIGWIGYTAWYTQHQRAEVGYYLFDEINKRKGYMSEALRAVLRYGFGAMNLHRVEAYIAPENEASKELVTKFSFRLEGLLKGHYWNNGQYEDSLIFSLLRSVFIKHEH